MPETDPLWTELRNDAREGASLWDWYCEMPPERTPYEVVRDEHGGWRDGYPVRRVLEVRITGEQEPEPPRRYSFTHDQLVDALYLAVGKYEPFKGWTPKNFLAQDLADSIIEALEADK